MMLILNVAFVLVAVAIIVLVLMQRGAGAQAGSGFGAGASGTVFGARGASNFLSKSTKWMAVAFFAIALFMGWRAAHSARPVQRNLGLMAEPEQPAAPKAAGELAAPAASSTVPAATPAAPAQSTSPQPEPTAPAQDK
ncbi:MAG: preprotein translocase subunit SecG [Pseudoxanthomonas sp.]